ncbi:DNA mismatch repair protein Mlh1 [Lichtheimia hyalospora FSU 10163]|nr:DNA mismatch repair protein Mlh1 [Lichtheimia hyalospora FSU 10163]
MMDIPQIRPLDTQVINRIAAGEIVPRPAGALKELIENSLDAGATNISILAKDGGIKLLQIQDNGHGIRREDLPIVCRRHTTSKLRTYDDLQQIGTYGFRGEALASISHVAHVTITTKTRDSQAAFKATYTDGEMNGEPRPCAGNDGTQIMAEDLFYDMPTRLRSFRSPSDEYNRILDVVGRYAIHNSSVGFTCKKRDATTADIQTSTTNNPKDTIRLIYGSTVANELLPVKQDYPLLGCKMTGLITSADYSEKRMRFLLFINNRSVESQHLKKAVDDVYTLLLPKGTHPFVYLSLEVDPKNVDVNIHPTKREVTLLNEERIVDAITKTMQERLENANYSRTFYTQSALPGAPPVPEKSSPGSDKGKKVAAYNMVRTDSRAKTLDTFVQRQPIISTPREDNTAESSSSSHPVPMDIVQESSTETRATKRPRITVRIKSIDKLRAAVSRSKHNTLTTVLSNHTFVGCIDDTLALIQHMRDLYLINYAVFSEELFYQVVLAEFSNFGRLKLTIPLVIFDCIMIALDTEEHKGTLPPDLGSKDHVAGEITNMLVSRADLLYDHFGVKIASDGYLIELPMLLKGYIPTMDKLPLFLLRLGTEVDWVNEEKCFDGVARELAIFYSAEPPLEPPASSETEKRQYRQEHEKYRWQVQHLVFPSFKTSQFVAPENVANAEAGYVKPLTSLSALFRIFKRC